LQQAVQSACATLGCARADGLCPRRRAIGSAGERLVHTEEVTGSIPVSPTQLNGRFRSRSWPFLISVQQRSTATLCIELAARALERLTGRGRGNLAVDLHRHPDLRVPEDPHGYARMDVQGHQERGAGTPGVMDLDIADASPRAAEREVPGKVPRLVRSSQGRGEYEVAVLLGVSHPAEIGRLELGAKLERGDTDIWDRQDGRRAGKANQCVVSRSLIRNQRQNRRVRIRRGQSRSGGPR
jgi:hypothetical protein